MSSAAHPLPGSLSSSALSATRVQARAAAVPWYIWVGVLAVTSAAVGGAWDVSWHRSIGRDSFWTPAHLAIQACGVLAAIVGIWLVARATLGSNPQLRATSVNIFGLRAPLGVFVVGWGGMAMITSAPFDNWWHAAYGLDVQIISPPHTLLILGMRAVSAGMLLLILATMNRAAEAANPATAGYFTLRRLFLYLGGLMISGQMFFLQSYTWDVVLHQMAGYIAMAIALPILFAAFSQTSQYKWAATTTASVYMLFVIAEILILPLFPAQPKLGPVFYPVTHMVPAKFPVLLFAPALALDLFWQRARTWKLWQIAAVSGLVFTVILFSVEWEFAKFLLSHWSRNRFFGSIYFDYATPANSYDRMYRFFEPDAGIAIVKGLAVATACAIASTWAGLGLGRWARGVQR